MRKIVRDMILKWHERGYDVEETSRLLKVSEREVADVIRHATPRQRQAARATPDFIQPDIDIPGKEDQ